MILHLIQRSPFTHSALTDCLNVLGAQDSILLMQDGAYGTQHPSLQTNTQAKFVLADDLQARGLSSTQDIKCIEYSEFVSLCERHQKVISWY